MEVIPCMEHVPVKDVRQSITIQMGQYNEKGGRGDSISIYDSGKCECGEVVIRLVAILRVPFATVMSPVNPDTMQGDTYALIREFKTAFLACVRREEVEVSLYGRLSPRSGTSQER